MKTAHLVCFRIGKETFAVDISAVREIVRPQAVTAVPGTPRYHLGIVNLRGRVISVLDLADRLGLAPTVVGPTSRILVVNVDGVTMGFLVDAATEVMKLPTEAVETSEDIKQILHADYLEGVGKLDDGLVILLDLRKALLNDDPPAGAWAVSAETNP